ncbi:MAG: leucine-rich repeat domain-containing protein, partial [Clostridia bacterium]|nr:leucine-rich repeat domain-containing protein [Clostridia bacterium]
MPVTEIGWSAFFGRENLKSVCLYGVETLSGSSFVNCNNLERLVLPDTLTAIQADVFSSDDNIREIIVDSANPRYYSIDNCLIETQSKTLILGGTQSIIPADGSITKIGTKAFSGRLGLTQITIPDTITEIGEEAFSWCSFTQLEIPSSVKKIDSQVFSDCADLSSLKLNYGLEEMGDMAFQGCTALTQVEIPSSVHSIGSIAFSGCTSLKSILLNEGLQNIGSGAFRGTAITQIKIPASFTAIVSLYAYGLFSECEQLVSVTVDSGNQTYHSAGNCIIKTATKTLTAGCNASVI